MSAARVTTDKAARKALPLATGCLDYFPDALLAVAEVSRIGNEQHNPGEPLHWAKEKSTDEPDALLRHLIDRGTIDVDGVRHSAKVAWRALAMLQREIEEERAPVNGTEGVVLRSFHETICTHEGCKWRGTIKNFDLHWRRTHLPPTGIIRNRIISETYHCRRVGCRLYFVFGSHRIAHECTFHGELLR